MQNDRLPVEPTPGPTSPPQFASEESGDVPNKRQVIYVFAALMFGSLVASSNMYIVLPAMPRIVAELGGLEYFSWVALAVMMTSTVTSPIFGKLSDLYGRKPLYLLGTALFTIGASVGGFAPNVFFLIAGRVVQGIGFGMMSPLSQIIIGDLVSPRERGKYQGPMSAALGVAAILGPTIGGVITDHLGWRWLFFVMFPLGMAAFASIFFLMRVPFVPRKRPIDYSGIVLLASCMVAFLFAVTWAGTKYPWNSPQIIGLLIMASVLFSLLIMAEGRAKEPVMPLGLWRNRIFALSTVATALQATAQFGPTYFVPMFVQGVLGESATSAGAALLPLSITTMLTGIISGQLIARTGRYKPMIAGGIICSAIGFYLMTRMDLATRPETIVMNLIFVGLGSGAAQNAFVLIVQNAVDYKDLGVATAANQMFRSLGNTTGIAILSTTLTARLADEIPRRVPAEALASAGVGETLGSGTVLDPSTMAQLPASIVLPLREALAASLQSVNLSIMLVLTLAVVVTLLIKEIPLRRTTRWSRAEEEELKATSKPVVQAG